MEKTYKVEDVMDENFYQVSVDDPLTKVSSIFSSKDVHMVFVVNNNGELHGVITERLLLKPHLNIIETKAGSIAIKVPRISKEDNIYETARKMIENNLKALPVTQDGKPIGVITVYHLAAASSDILSKIRVRDVMSKDPITVSISDTIGKAISLMRENGISRLPVINNGKLEGIVTVHDIIEKVLRPRERATYGEIIGEKAKTLSNKVKDIMSKPVYTTTKDENLVNALNRMKQQNISCLVVVEDQRVIGIITLMDILEPLAALAKERRMGITIQVSYKLSNIPPDDKERVMEMAEKFVKKLGDTLGNGSLTLYFKEHKEKHGDMHLIHCRARLRTDKYQFVGMGEAWRADFAARTALEKIERQILIERELAAKYPYSEEILRELAESY